MPRTARTDTDVTSAVADSAQISLAPEIVTRRSTVKARKGETVASIAKRYGLAVASVAEWNSTSASAGFKVGQQVVVFLPVRAQSAGSASTVKTSKHGSTVRIVKIRKR